MNKARRSGRISKQVPVLLLGTDTFGRIFSEETSTLVLSRHGAGVLSCYKLVPDEILTLRLLGSSREAEVRLVGHIGQHGTASVYGLAFTEPELDFWQMEFPPPVTDEAAPAAFNLACCVCDTCQSVLQSDIEEDVYAVNDGILRYCECCGMSTNWRRAKPGVQPTPPKLVAPPSIAAATTPSLPSLALPFPVRVPLGSLSSYSSAPPDQVDLASSQQLTAATAVLDLPLAPVSPPPGAVRPAVGGVNRRRDVRTAVTFTACVRHAVSGDEIVECDNISRGGASFRSRRRYPEGTLIEIAVPYAPGEHAIFVMAMIRHIDELPALLFRYGVSYARAPRRVFPA